MSKRFKSADSSEKSIGVIFGLIGVVLLIIMLVMLINNLEEKSNIVEVKAEIVDIQRHTDSDGDTSSRVYVTFDYDGIRYEKVRYYPLGSVELGEIVTMEVNKDNPRKTYAEDSYIVIGILLVMGSIFSLVGFVILNGVRKNRKLKKMVLNCGTVIQAVVQNVYVDRSLAVNGRSPVRLVCSYTEPHTGRVYAFTSDKVWDDLYAIFGNGSPVKVYVMPGDYTKYYVDLENSAPTYNIVDFS